MKDAALLEVSYEVANKIGGIYTVLVSKMAYALQSFRDYYAIGPYNEASASSEFREEPPPEAMKSVFSTLEERQGIKCRYGTWLIEKKPKAILVDPGRFREKTNEVKGELWEKHKIDSWGTDAWFNDPVIWAKSAGMLIEELARTGFFKNGVVAHFHEWLSGPALLHLSSTGTGIPTVFTTHSTVLGRAIAETGREDLYGLIESHRRKGHGIPDGKAYEYNTQAKHLTEKATAQKSTIFTTVSEIMARECESILCRKPDAVLPNGLDMNKFPTAEEVPRMHETTGERMRNFLLGYFLPYYEVEPEDSTICFLSGRHEYRNKGIDVFIEALSRLNATLKKERAKKEVFAFIWVPQETAGRKPTVVEHLEVFDDVEALIEKESEKIEKGILRAFIKGKLPKDPKLSSSGFLREMKALSKRMKSMGGERPPVCPFELKGENVITRALAEKGLRNGRGDRVKVIYYPAYLSEKDGLLGMKYYSAMAACDVGVFPSYYESWGYTPLEAAALGLHSVTTDLSGFGKFIKPHLKNGESSISVLKRDGRAGQEVSAELHDLLLRIHRMGSDEASRERARAKELSMLADWGRLYKNYVRAYGLAAK